MGWGGFQVSYYGRGPLLLWGGVPCCFGGGPMLLWGHNSSPPPNGVPTWGWGRRLNFGGVGRCIKDPPPPHKNTHISPPPQISSPPRPPHFQPPAPELPAGDRHRLVREGERMWGRTGLWGVLFWGGVPCYWGGVPCYWGGSHAIMGGGPMLLRGVPCYWGGLSCYWGGPMLLRGGSYAIMGGVPCY